MARAFAKTFYHSKAWKHTRESYFNSVHGLCERCLKRGQYVPGEIVHHIKHIEPWNIGDESVTLNFDNLELVCRDCHAELHPEIYKTESTCRVRFDDFGNIIPPLEEE